MAQLNFGGVIENVMIDIIRPIVETRGTIILLPIVVYIDFMKFSRYKFNCIHRFIV